MLGWVEVSLGWGSAIKIYIKPCFPIMDTHIKDVLRWIDKFTEVEELMIFKWGLHQPIQEVQMSLVCLFVIIIINSYSAPSDSLFDDRTNLGYF